MSFETVTMRHMLFEKRFYLNKSNSKWWSIGIVPFSKLFADEATGFYTEIAIHGNNAKQWKPMFLGGIDGLFQSLREFDELKYLYPTAKCDYALIENDVEMTVTKR